MHPNSVQRNVHCSTERFVFGEDGVSDGIGDRSIAARAAAVGYSRGDPGRGARAPARGWSGSAEPAPGGAPGRFQPGGALYLLLQPGRDRRGSVRRVLRSGWTPICDECLPICLCRSGSSSWGWRTWSSPATIPWTCAASSLATSQEGLPSSSGTAVGLGAMRLITEPFSEAMEQGVFGADPVLSPAEAAYGCWALVHGMVSISGDRLDRGSR